MQRVLHGVAEVVALGETFYLAWSWLVALVLPAWDHAICSRYFPTYMFLVGWVVVVGAVRIATRHVSPVPLAFLTTLQDVRHTKL